MNQRRRFRTLTARRCSHVSSASTTKKIAAIATVTVSHVARDASSDAMPPGVVIRFHTKPLMWNPYNS